jgi:protein gp37
MKNGGAAFPVFDSTGRRNSYPMDFMPTFHRYKLERPQTVKTPQNVFVCSMADLFGEWVPDEWIQQVFEACAAAPWHRYIFLTKNHERYSELYYANKLPQPNNFWYGVSLTDDGHDHYGTKPIKNSFVSIEPILNHKVLEVYFGYYSNYDKWVILGLETGNRKNKFIPEKKHIEENLDFVKKYRNPIAVFMKDSLASIWGEPLIQEYPWEKKA